jgi:hypothetical protein
MEKWSVGSYYENRPPKAFVLAEFSSADPTNDAPSAASLWPLYRFTSGDFKPDPSLSPCDIFTARTDRGRVVWSLDNQHCIMVKAS